MATDPDKRAESQPAVDSGMPVTDRIKLGLGAAGAVVLIVFLFQNMEDARVNLLWMEFTTPLFFALLTAAALGAVVTMLIGFFRGRARRTDRREDRRT